MNDLAWTALLIIYVDFTELVLFSVLPNEVMRAHRACGSILHIFCVCAKHPIGPRYAAYELWHVTVSCTYDPANGHSRSSCSKLEVKPT